MMRTLLSLRSLAVILSAICYLTPQQAQAAVAIATAGVASDTTNYGSAGLNIGGRNAGADGFWFANFNAGAAVTGAPVDQNDANSLPSWMSVQFNPIPAATYSFTPNATSTGGQGTYNTLTLPDNSSGLSGQLVDNLNAGGVASNTITTRWMFGAGAPSSLYISVVLDNAPTSAGTVVQRLRMSNFAADLSTNQQATYDNLAAGANGIADVYTFNLTGIEVGGMFTVQLRTNGNAGFTADTALAGMMFTNPVPEPSSVAMLAFAAVGLGGTARKLRRQG